ncbi:hypothetical protein [Dactylosporangium fulvum]|uniref:hypothetical protein n=1 Tax=Dactylosporangium fulvum TaxID=53359 RepID=UPI0031CF8BE7
MVVDERGADASAQVRLRRDDGTYRWLDIVGVAGAWLNVGAATGSTGDLDRLLRDADAAMFRAKIGRKTAAGA